MTHPDALRHLAEVAARSEPPAVTLDEWINEAYEHSARIVSETIQELDQTRRRKGPGYTGTVAMLERRKAAAQGYRNAMHELREALKAGRVTT